MKAKQKYKTRRWGRPSVPWSARALSGPTRPKRPCQSVQFHSPATDTANDTVAAADDAPAHEIRRPERRGNMNDACSQCAES